MYSECIFFIFLGIRINVMKKIMKRTSILVSIAAVLCLVLFSNCGGKKGAEAPAQDSLSAEERSALFAYPIPTSYEVTEMLNNAGAAYILTLINDPKSVDNYITEKSKALNLGIYSADLCYTSTYNMKQDMMGLLESAKKLIDNLEINTPFTQKFLQRMEANSENKDSTVVILSESIQDSYAFLKSNNKEDVTLLVMSGSLVEGLYITTQMATLYPNNQELLKIVAAQKTTFKEVYKMLEPMSGNEEIKEIFESFGGVSEFYESVSIGMPVDGDQLKEITKMIEGIRTKIVAG